MKCCRRQFDCRKKADQHLPVWKVSPFVRILRLENWFSSVRDVLYRHIYLVVEDLLSKEFFFHMTALSPELVEGFSLLWLQEVAENPLSLPRIRMTVMMIRHAEIRFSRKSSAFRSELNSFRDSLPITMLCVCVFYWILGSAMLMMVTRTECWSRHPQYSISLETIYQMRVFYEWVQQTYVLSKGGETPFIFKRWSERRERNHMKNQHELQSDRSVVNTSFTTVRWEAKKSYAKRQEGVKRPSLLKKRVKRVVVKHCMRQFFRFLSLDDCLCVSLVEFVCSKASRKEWHRKEKWCKNS